MIGPTPNPIQDLEDFDYFWGSPGLLEFSDQFSPSVRCPVRRLDKDREATLAGLARHPLETGADQPGLVGERQTCQGLLPQQCTGALRQIGRRLAFRPEAPGEQLAARRLGNLGGGAGHPDAPPRQLAAEVRHDLAGRRPDKADELAGSLTSRVTMQVRSATSPSPSCRSASAFAPRFMDLPTLPSPAPAAARPLRLDPAGRDAGRHDDGLGLGRQYFEAAERALMLHRLALLALGPAG